MGDAAEKLEQRTPEQWSADQIKTLKRTIAKDLTDDELDLFIATSARLGLDPFARQIYAIKRKDGDSGDKRMSIQVAIDGFRLVAQRTGEYEGQDEPQWCGEDGKWLDVWLKKEQPFAARVAVYRRGFRKPLVAIAKMSAFNAGGRMWTKMPDHMLAKCAEALALRKAFPNELSGVYAPEEMDQADGGAEPRDAMAGQQRSTSAPASSRPRTLDDVAGGGEKQPEQPKEGPPIREFIKVLAKSFETVTAGELGEKISIAEGLRQGMNEAEDAHVGAAIKAARARLDQPKEPKEQITGDGIVIDLVKMYADLDEASRTSEAAVKRWYAQHKPELDHLKEAGKDADLEGLRSAYGHAVVDARKLDEKGGGGQ